MAKSAAKVKAKEGPLEEKELALMHAYWRACNYLSVGMIYLRDNPLLQEAAQASTTSSTGCSATGARARRCRSSGRI